MWWNAYAYQENLANEIEMDSDDLVCRGSFDGCAWNGSGARRQKGRDRRKEVTSGKSEKR